MGCSKPMLRHQSPPGLTFLGHLVREARAAGLERIFVVGRSGDEPVRAEAAAHAVVFVENRRADEGQLSSLQAGMAAASGALRHQLAAVLLMPVDVPLISAASIEALLAAAAGSPAVIVRAAHGGRHGHPVLFKQPVFEELFAADPAVGARAVVRADPARVQDVEVNDPGVTIDVDTPDDYRRYFGREPSVSR